MALFEFFIAAEATIGYHFCPLVLIFFGGCFVLSFSILVSVMFVDVKEADLCELVIG